MGETDYGKCRNLSVRWEFSKSNNKCVVGNPPKPATIALIFVAKESDKVRHKLQSCFPYMLKTTLRVVNTC